MVLPALVQDARNAIFAPAAILLAAGGDANPPRFWATCMSGGLLVAKAAVKLAVIATRRGRGALPWRERPVHSMRAFSLRQSIAASVHLPRETLPCFVVAKSFWASWVCCFLA